MLLVRIVFCFIIENVFVCPDQLCLCAGHLKILALSDVDATVR